MEGLAPTDAANACEVFVIMQKREREEEEEEDQVNAPSWHFFFFCQLSLKDGPIR